MSFDQYLISLVSPAAAAQTEIRLTPLNSSCLFFCGDLIISRCVCFVLEYIWAIGFRSYVPRKMHFTAN